MNANGNSQLNKSGGRRVRRDLWCRFIQSQDEVGVYHHPTYLVELDRLADEIEERNRKIREERIKRGENPDGWGDYDDDDVDPIE